MTKMELFYAVAGTLAGVLTVIFAKWGTEFKKMADKTPTKVDDYILKFAKMGVEYAEKYFNGSSNETKKKMATLETLKQLGENGVKEVSNAVLGQAIETAVKEKKEKEAGK